jgi:hypothetical protein
MYAQHESGRVIEAVRDAAQGFTQLGAAVTPTSETWEDFFPGFMAATYLYPTGGARPERPSAQVWEHALDSRRRTYDKFRAVLGEHDVLLSRVRSVRVRRWSTRWPSGDRPPRERSQDLPPRLRLPAGVSAPRPPARVLTESSLSSQQHGPRPDWEYAGSPLSHRCPGATRPMPLRNTSRGYPKHGWS